MLDKIKRRAKAGDKIVNSVEDLLLKCKSSKPLTSLEIELQLKGKKSKGCIYKEFKNLVKHGLIIKLIYENPNTNKKIVAYKIKSVKRLKD